MTRSIIVAIGREREIGIGANIPWDISADRRKFREVTTGHTVIIGRKTYELIVGALGKPLPNRTNIVITGDENFEAPGCIVVHSVEEALGNTDPNEEVFIIGGATIYEQALPFADKLYVTHVEGSYPEADVFFPEINPDEWEAGEAVILTNPEKDSVSATFIVYERKKDSDHG